MKNLTYLRVLTVLLPAMLLTNCEASKESAPSPVSAKASDAAAAAPVPCASEGYGVDANGVGAYQLPSPRTVGMTTSLTGLTYLLTMTQTKYIITPAGKELSVWQGLDTVTPPTSKQVLDATAWSECNKGYQSKCVRYTDGRVTLSLTTDPSVLPFEN
jgi:hypothetical protein